MLAPKSMRALPTDSPNRAWNGHASGIFKFLWQNSLYHNTAVNFYHDAFIVDVFSLFMRKSFKNLVYIGIYCRATPKGMVISNFLNISRKQAKYHSFSFFDGTKGYGASFTGTDDAFSLPPSLTNSWS